MHSQTPHFFEMLQTLARHQVEFIVVGGVCGLLHGAPITTFDLDILRSTDKENNEKLLRALEEMNGLSRLHKKDLRPNRSHLEAQGHILLRTEFGPLDLLANIGNNRNYDELLSRTVQATLKNVTFYMLDLETLIKIKEETGRDKDKAVLPTLISTLREKNQIH